MLSKLETQVLKNIKNYPNRPRSFYFKTIYSRKGGYMALKRLLDSKIIRTEKEGYKKIITLTNKGVTELEQSNNMAR